MEPTKPRSPRRRRCRSEANREPRSERKTKQRNGRRSALPGAAPRRRGRQRGESQRRGPTPQFESGLWLRWRLCIGLLLRKARSRSIRSFLICPAFGWCTSACAPPSEMPGSSRPRRSTFFDPCSRCSRGSQCPAFPRPAAPCELLRAPHALLNKSEVPADPRFQEASEGFPLSYARSGRAPESRISRLPLFPFTCRPAKDPPSCRKRV